MKNLKKITEVKECEHKVNRELPPIGILNDIIQILGERNIREDDIVRAKDFLSCKITKNENIVQEYRKKICSIIPNLCDAVDDMDYEKMEDILSPVLSSQADDRNPEDKMINYYIEKFHNYFFEKIYSGNSGEEQRLRRDYWISLAPFVEEWAKKRGVVIDAKKMEDNEIDLLITVVCYFDYAKKQRREKPSPLR